jgi:hypothetical protein
MPAAIDAMVGLVTRRSSPIILTANVFFWFYTETQSIILLVVVNYLSNYEDRQTNPLPLILMIY